MIKSKFFLPIILQSFIYFTSFGQLDTAKFKDGTSIVYEIADSNPDNMKRFNISYLITSGANLSYLQPDRFTGNVNVDKWKYGIEGVCFITSFEQNRTRKFIIKSYFAEPRLVKNYIIRPTIPIKTYLGIHLGFYSNDFSKQYFSAYPNYLKSREVFVGLALMRLRCTKLNIFTNASAVKRNGVIQTNLYCDFVKYLGIEYAGTNLPNTGTLDDNSVSIGYRIYADGKLSYSVHGEHGLTWKIGFQNGPYKKTIFLYGIGYYIGF